MITLIDYLLFNLKQIRPESKDLNERQAQILYHETLEYELNEMTSHREV